MVARKKKAEPQPPAPSLSAEDAARIAAETVKAYQAQAPAPALSANPDLDQKVEVYEELEKLFPDRYPKGSGRRIAQAEAAEQTYADSWEAEHPGQVFDASAPEHAAWYRSNYPDTIPTVNKKHLAEAEFEIKFRQRAEKLLSPQLEEVRRAATLAQAEPKARALAAALSDVTSQVFEADKDKAKWAESHPVHAKLLDAATQRAQAVAYKASLLWDGAERLDDRDPAHQAAVTYFQRMESELAAHPDPIVNDYRQKWVPVAEYEKLPAQKRAGFFTTTKDALANYIARSEALQAKSLLTELGLDKLSVSPVTQAAPAAPATPAPATAPSPSVSAGAPTPARVGAVAHTPSKPSSPFARALGIG